MLCKTTVQTIKPKIGVMVGCPMPETGATATTITTPITAPTFDQARASNKTGTPEGSEYGRIGQPHNASLPILEKNDKFVESLRKISNGKVTKDNE